MTTNSWAIWSAISASATRANIWGWRFLPTASRQGADEHSADSNRLFVTRFALFVLLLPLISPSVRGQDAETTNISSGEYKSACRSTHGARSRPSGIISAMTSPTTPTHRTGKSLLGELAALSPAPVYVRVHNLLDHGRRLRFFEVGIDQRLHRRRRREMPFTAGRSSTASSTPFTRPESSRLVEIGFMPEALSTHPEPYRHNFPKARSYTGWAYPPKDYAEMVGASFPICPSPARALRRCRSKNLAVGSLERTGHRLLEGNAARNISSSTISAPMRFCARFRKPASAARTAPARAIPKRRNSCASSSITARISPTMSAEKSARLCDFISFHPKGSPKWQGDHVQMGIARQLAAIEQGFQIVASFPEWRQHADRSGRIGPGRMRRLLRAGQSTECLPQRTAVRFLHGRSSEQYLLSGRPRARQFSRSRDLVI